MRKILSALLCLCMIISIFPATTLAADVESIINIGADGKPSDLSGDGWTYDSSQNTITLNRGYEFTFQGNPCEATINNYGTIAGGTFNGTVNNTSDTKSTKVAGGIINDGIFNGEVVNFHGWSTCSINGGTFNGVVKNQNHGVINNGVFNDEVDTFMLGNKVNGGSSKLVFVLDGGQWKDESIVPQYYTYSTSAQSLPDGSNIKVDGYIFDAWYDTADFSGSPVSVIPAKNIGKLTLYARFVDGITSWQAMGETAVLDADYSIDADGNYSVMSAVGLAKIANIVNGGDNLNGKKVTLTTDIDLLDAGVVNYDNGTVNEHNSWIPIKGFAGTFEGNGKKIENLYIVTTNADAGLFDNNIGTIQNLEVASGAIVINLPDLNNFSEYHAGGITATTSGIIDNCINRASVKAVVDGGEQIYIGGIAGLVITSGVSYAADVSTISNCENYGEVSNTGSATINNIYGGGIAGGLTSGETTSYPDRTSLIDGCINKGTVRMQSGMSNHAGGIVGEVSTATTYEYTVEVRNSENHADVSGNNAGGIAAFGEYNVLICNNYNMAEITGESAGGIAGLLNGGEGYYPHVINNYTTQGSVIGKAVDCEMNSCYFSSEGGADAIGSYVNGGITSVNDTYSFTSEDGKHTFVDSNEQKTQLVDALNKYVNSSGETKYMNWVPDITNNNYPVFGAGDSVLSIKVNSTTHKKVYELNDPLDVTNLTILVTYANGDSETVTVTEDMVSGFDSSVAGLNKKPVITYKGSTCNYTVHIANWVVRVYRMGLDGQYSDDYELYRYGANTYGNGTWQVGTTYGTGNYVVEGFTRDEELSITRGTLSSSNPMVILKIYLSRNQYKLTFNDGSETPFDEKNVYYEAPITIPEGSPDKEGYTFTGWGDIADTMPAEDINYTAQWKINTYLIKYNSNGGIGEMTDQSFTYEEEKALTRNEFTRSGYSFKGWATAADGAVSYTNEQVVSKLTAVDAGVVELFAVWQRNSGGGGSYTPSYKVNVSEDIVNGTVTSSAKTAKSNATVTITVKADTDYEIDTLTVTNKNGKTVETTEKADGTYTFKMPASDVTVMATFKAVDDGKDDEGNSGNGSGWSECPKNHICPIYPFKDADPKAWYHDGVHFCIDEEYMLGYPDGTFQPNTATSRAMIITMLWRMEGSPKVEYAHGFNDVKADDWYADAITWGASEGIITGYGNGIGAPNDVVTREQMAAFFYRFAEYKGVETSPYGDLDVFIDSDEISNWAIESMKWAVGFKLINGYGNGVIAPVKNATRAEIAQIFMNYNTVVNK